jgi:putative membrane protein
VNGVVGDLPAVNAGLNGAAAVLLAIGLWQIKRRRVTAHKACMLAAFVVSMVFLASYLVYHLQVGSVRFAGPGSVRPVYLGILVSHTILAAAVPILAVVTLTYGLRARYARHTRIARWTLPVWLYVSVTGVIVYLMLYRLFPAA